MKWTKLISLSPHSIKQLHQTVKRGKRTHDESKELGFISGKWRGNDWCVESCFTLLEISPLCGTTTEIGSQ